jgi:low affinity Fe/Cu permease
MHNSELCGEFSKWISRATGHPAAFALAILLVVLWLTTGPIFGFSDTWQLVINTFTTIVTFLMVFMIQNTQNRDTAAMQVKLDELIRAVHGARNSLIDLEDQTDEELEQVKRRFEEIAQHAKSRVDRVEAQVERHQDRAEKQSQEKRDQRGEPFSGKADGKSG